MKKSLLILLISIFIFSCGSPLDKVDTEEAFMLDMVEVRESEGQETAEKLSGYVLQQVMIQSFNKEAKSKLIGKTYDQLLIQADDLAAELKVKEEEEKRLAEEEKQKREALELKISESVTFACTKKGYVEVNYSDYITYTFTFKNKTDKNISGVKGLVTFYDMFDEEIKGLRLSYDGGVKAGQTINYNAQTDYNQFIDEDVKLKNTKLEKMKVVWQPEQLIFSDGDKISLE